MGQRCQRFDAGGMFDTFLGAFTKVWKAIINFVMSVRLYAWNISSSTGRNSLKFYIWVLFGKKKCLENSSFVKIGKEKRALFMKTAIYFWSYLVPCFSEWQMFPTKFVEEIKIHILCPINFFFFFFFQILTVYEKMWKSIVETYRPQIPIWCMRITYWTPKDINTLRICNTYCFSTETMFVWTCLILTLYRAFHNVLRDYKHL